MHNAAFGALELDGVYLPFPAADADDFVTFGRAIGVQGASVTIPFKVALRDRVDEADPIARRIGAINTIRAIDGRWIGGNTDAAAFLRPLRDRVPLPGARVAVLGAGGAARAVVVALASSQAHVTVHARDRKRAEEVAMTVSGAVGPLPPEAGSWDLLVNCTPVGMYPNVDATPVDAAALTGRLRVRPRLQPAEHAAVARGGEGRVPDDRGTRDARGTGARAVRVVDRREAAGRRHAGGRAEAARGVYAR